jgi:hypothetical protein
MTRTSKILIALGVIVIAMATIHFSLNGLPDLGSWNPHSR